jgi:uncharacterized protein YjbI with pentapeptide repeats
MESTLQSNLHGTMRSYSKMKRTLTALTVAATMFASNASAFDPADLRKLFGTNECVSCDLRGADLTYADLGGADLRGADLFGADLDVTGDGFTEPFINDAEQAARDMVDFFGDMTAAEAEALKDETEAAVAANAREIDPDAAPENQPAPVAVRTAPGTPLATADQSIAQQIGTLDW